MSTTQSEDPNEKVDHPRHYNQHPSGIETIELIEHLPYNLGAAVKYVWRCGLKKSDTPLRDLESAKWYVNRENWRVDTFELEDDLLPEAALRRKTDVVWRSCARKVMAKEPNTPLSDLLQCMLDYDFLGMVEVIEEAIAKLPKPETV